MDVEYDEAKLTELMVYVANRLRDDRAGGATKLNKALFFADFTHVRRYGKPITGAAYQKLPYGPAPGVCFRSVKPSSNPVMPRSSRSSSSGVGSTASIVSSSSSLFKLAITGTPMENSRCLLWVRDPR